jgi:hypothetical protein
MSHTKLSMVGNNLINPHQGELMISDIPAGYGKSQTFFFTVHRLSVSYSPSEGLKWPTFFDVVLFGYNPPPHELSQYLLISLSLLVFLLSV